MDVLQPQSCSLQHIFLPAVFRPRRQISQDSAVQCESGEPNGSPRERQLFFCHIGAQLQPGRSLMSKLTITDGKDPPFFIFHRKTHDKSMAMFNSELVVITRGCMSLSHPCCKRHIWEVRFGDSHSCAPVSFTSQSIRPQMQHQFWSSLR